MPLTTNNGHQQPSRPATRNAGAYGGSQGARPLRGFRTFPLFVFFSFISTDKYLHVGYRQLHATTNSRPFTPTTTTGGLSSPQMPRHHDDGRVGRQGTEQGLTKRSRGCGIFLSFILLYSTNDYLQVLPTITTATTTTVAAVAAT
jgi:hypothetical protein